MPKAKVILYLGVFVLIGGLILVIFQVGDFRSDDSQEPQIESQDTEEIIEPEPNQEEAVATPISADQVSNAPQEPQEVLQVSEEGSDADLDQVFASGMESSNGTEAKPQLTSIEGLLVIIIFIFAALIIYLCNLLMQFYKWRMQIKDSDKSVMLPEIHLQKLEDLTTHSQELYSQISQSRKSTHESTKINKEILDEILTSFLSLRTKIGEVEAENARLKSGYDNAIKKKFTSGLLKLRERIEHFVNNGNSSEETVKACEGMLVIFDNILDQESISYFEYEPGENIRDIEYFEVNERIPTTDIEKINTVIKTVSRGYRLEGLEDQHIIIKKAKIDCYVEE